MILKLFGAVTLLACGAAYSRAAQRAARAELEETERALSLFTRIKSEISDFRTPLWEILSKNGVSCGLDGYVDSLSPPLAELISEAKKLGKGYSSEELRLCDGIVRRLEERQKRLKEKAREVSALSRVKGYGTAVAVIILLL